MADPTDTTPGRAAALGFTAMEFRRVARMNRHQLWSICVAWCRDRTAATSVLGRGLTMAWASVKEHPAHFLTGNSPLSLRLTETVYHCVLDAASGSLAADQMRTAAADEDASLTLSAEEISFYILENYSPLSRTVACDLLDITDDGSAILDRVAQVLLREERQHR